MISFSNTDLVVEPARVHYLRFVRSVNIGNTGRTIAVPPTDCYDDTLYATVNQRHTVIPYRTGITGKIRFKEGYNCQLYQKDNTIVIGAIKGMGLSLSQGQDSEIPRYPGEEPPSSSPFLSGGVPCNRTVKSINGLTDKSIPIIAGAGITVEVEDNVLTIKATDTQFKKGCETITVPQDGEGGEE